MSRTKFDNMVLIIAVVVALFLLTICGCSPRVIANRKCPKYEKIENVYRLKP